MSGEGKQPAACRPRSSALPRLYGREAPTIQNAQNHDLTLDQLFTRPYIWGTPPEQVKWSKQNHVCQPRAEEPFDGRVEENGSS
jgi:hypothetical protein